MQSVRKNVSFICMFLPGEYETVKWGLLTLPQGFQIRVGQIIFYSICFYFILISTIDVKISVLVKNKRDSVSLFFCGHKQLI
jgi:hypothetical protein